MKTTRASAPIICLGDSLTAGDPHVEDGQWPTRLQWLLGRSQPESSEVYNCGVAGNTSAQGLDRMEEAVMPLLPGRVLIAFGINDCNVRPNRRTPRVGVSEFASNLREAIRMVRTVDGLPILLSPHYPEPDRRAEGLRKYDQGNGLTYAENFRPYHLAAQRVARGCEVSLIDMPKLIVRAGRKVSDLLAEDGVHLTAEGNRFYAEQIQPFFSA